jgi:glutamate-5-semialdehyde dehydrogenase
MNVEQIIKDMAVKAKKAAVKMGRLSADEKNRALLMMAENIEKDAAYLQAENKKDVDRAREIKGRHERPFPWHPSVRPGALSILRD